MIKDKIDVEIGGGLDFQLPKMVKIKQRFAGDHLADIPTEVGRQMGKPDVKNRIKAGQRIAVGCGSRGIANIDIVVKRVIEELIAAGAKPFIFPCMGSHGAIAVPVHLRKSNRDAPCLDPNHISYLFRNRCYRNCMVIALLSFKA